MKYRKFPMYIDISKKNILIEGAGNIGGRRVRKLIDFTGNIFVVAPSIHENLEKLLKDGKITWINKKYDISDLENMDIVIAATDDEEVNRKICEDAIKLGKIVNNASDKEQCDFQFPGVINYGDICISFNGNGDNHKETREIREKISKFLKGIDKNG